MQRRVVLHMFSVMDTDSHPQHLSLMQALTQWTEPALVAKVKMRERSYSAADLAYFTSLKGQPPLSDESELRQTGPHEWMVGTPNYALLIAAHNDLVQDFRDRMVSEKFYLQGVQTKPVLTTEPQSIPGVWAAECEFDFSANIVTIAKQRFVAVAASRVVLIPAAPNLPAFREVDPKALSDEELLALLLEHVRRAVESPEPKMMVRIKDVLQPIIMRRLEWRAANDKLALTLAEEARQLQAWIAKVAPWHPIPSPKTIENNIRDAYRRLRP